MITVADLRDAVEVACGNLTHAAAVLGVSKRHALRLAKRYALGDFARDLRQQVYGQVAGRPRRV